MNILKKKKWILLNFKFGITFFVFLVAGILPFVQRASALEIINPSASGDQKWTFEPSTIPDAVNIEKKTMLKIKNTNMYFPIVLDDATIEILPDSIFEIFTITETSINEPKIWTYLEEKITKKIEKPASNTNIYRDQNGNIAIDGKTENGFSVDKNRFIENINFALNKNISRVQIPVIEIRAQITVSENLKELGIKELVATGHSAFVGSPKGRLHNIRTGIKRYNGLLVKPGEVFSFNKHLGPVDKKHDFLEELVIKPEGTILEYGGGLCQISSTLYRAALFGGFPIVERAPHSYAVSYYAQVGGYGLDATVYPGARDVRFLNDSPAHLLIQAYTDGDHAWYKFYGTPDDRKIRLEGPAIDNRISAGPSEIIETDKLSKGVKKQVEKKHNGFDVTWYRYVMKDGIEKKEKIFSRYRAIPEKILVGKTAP